MGLIEIIVINDGSTDNSVNEIERYITHHRDFNLVLINQHNQGLSAARNTGLIHAKGEYIAFLDADDLWAPSLWDTVAPILKNQQPDMLIYNASRFFDDDISNKSLINVTKLNYGLHQINNISDLSKIFETNCWFAWCRIYKKQLFRDELFPVNREYEDLAKIPFITVKAKSIFSVPLSLMLYRSRASSITNKPKHKHIEDIIYAMDCLYHLYANSDEKDKALKELARLMQHEYSLLRSINKKINGYCYFNKQQQQRLKYILLPFQNKFKLSLKFKAKFIGVYSFIAKLKHRAYMKMGK